MPFLLNACMKWHSSNIAFIILIGNCELIKRATFKVQLPLIYNAGNFILSFFLQIKTESSRACRFWRHVASFGSIWRFYYELSRLFFPIILHCIEQMQADVPFRINHLLTLFNRLVLIPTRSGFSVRRNRASCVFRHSKLSSCLKTHFKILSEVGIF